MRPFPIRLAVAVLFLLLVVTAVLSADERIFRLTDRPPVEFIVVGELTDLKGNGKKFAGEGEVVLDDGRHIAVGVVQKRNAKKLKSTFVLKTPKGALPKIKATLKTVGDPEVITLLKFLMKDVDKTKSKLKDKAKEGIPAIELTSVDPDLSDQRTLEGVKLLLGSEDDFPGAIAKFDAAIGEDYRNPNPVLFRGLAEFLDFLDTSMNSPSGTVNDMYVRSGYTNSATSFWAPVFERQPLFEGQVPDAVPTANEAVDFLRDELVPAIEKLLVTTASTPTSFEYRVNFLDSTGEFFDDSPVDDVETVWVDYGDVQMLRACLQVTLAVLDFLHAYDYDNLDPDDFDGEDYPDLDPLAILESDYPRAGKLVRTDMLESARDHLKDAFESYKAGAAFILAETTAQRDNGFVTPYRAEFRGETLFDTAAERTQFLTEEEAFRSWAQAIVDRLEVDSPLTIATRPNGTAIPAGQRLTLNLVEFFKGVRIRTLYFKTIEDPRSGRLTFGVEDIGDIVADMVTLDGAVVKYNDAAPGPGDLLGGKGQIYGLRLSSIPTDTKTVDGDLSDWSFGKDSVQAVAPPVIAYHAPQPDFGEVWISKDSTNLYLAHTGNPLAFDDLSIDFESDSGYAYVGLGWSWGAVSDPVAVPGLGGTELSVPLSNFGTDEWVEIRFEALIDDPWASATVGGVFVKIR